jgi:hypothetical protein
MFLPIFRLSHWAHLWSAESLDVSVEKLVGETVRDKVNKILNYSFFYHVVVSTVVKL